MGNLLNPIYLILCSHSGPYWEYLKIRGLYKGNTIFVKNHFVERHKLDQTF